MSDVVESLRKAASFLSRVRKTLESLPSPAYEVAAKGLVEILNELDAKRKGTK